MKIRDLLAVESIDLNGKVTGKNEALDAMVALMAKSGKINDVEKYRKGVYAREEEGTTGIGEGIAIPHCKSDAVSRPGLAAMVIKDGVDFDALDGEKVSLIFLIAAPNTEDNVHLDVLSKLSVLLMDENFTNGLKQAASSISFAVSTFFAPPEPLVSTLIKQPNSAAFFSRLSAAMYVWAIPVGHPVTARIFF